MNTWGWVVLVCFIIISWAVLFPLVYFVLRALRETWVAIWKDLTR